VLLFLAVAVVGGVVVIAGGWYNLSGQSQPQSVPESGPPRILGIVATPSDGDSSTPFTFTAQVVDVADPVRAIEVRWAWANDHSPSTAWSTNKSWTHVFPVPGSYVIQCQAKNANGLTANKTLLLHVAPRPLRIGTALSLTGALQFFGPGEEKAVDMAVAEINAAGGVNGSLVQVFHQDDGTDSNYAAAAARTLIGRDHVDVIIGSTFSSGCIAILPLARANGVFEISPSASSVLFSDQSYTGGWFARTIPSDALQGVVGARYARTNLSFTYSAVIGGDDAYGRRVTAAFGENFSRFRGTITTGSPRVVSQSVTDYTADLHAVLDVIPAPQLVYLAAYLPVGQTMLRNWWAGIPANPAWANVKWMFSDGLDDQGFIDFLASSGVNVTGFRGTSPSLPEFMPARYPFWAARYQARYGSPPPLFAANAYDATYLVALAAQAAGISGTAIRAHIRDVASPPGTLIAPGNWSVALRALHAGAKVNYDGASGSVDLNSFGDVPAGYVIWAVNRTNRLYTQAYFDEASVVSMLQNGFFPSIPWQGPAIILTARGAP
jgi:ABC-type branched-subunit amino acid transport system substrate-binding protein